MRFRLKTCQQRIKLLSFILSWTNTFQPAKTAVSLRSSPLKRLFSQAKQFSALPFVHTNTQSVFIKNASIWKRPREWIKTKTHTNRISVDGRKRNKTKWKRWPQISQVRVFIASASQFYHFRTFYCGRKSIDAFSMTKKTHTFETH